MTNETEPVDVAKSQGKFSTPLTPPSFGWTDAYSVFITLPIVPLALAMWLLITLISIPFMPIAALVFFYAKKPAKYGDEGMSRPLWTLLLVSTFVLSLPRTVVALSWWLFVLCYAHLAALPWALVTGKLFTGTFTKNLSLVRPFLDLGRSLDFVWDWRQQVQLTLGGAYRQGRWEFLLGAPFIGGWASTVAYIPIVKYCFTCNVFLHDLQETFVNQWTAPLAEHTQDEVVNALKYNVSHCFHDAKARCEIDDSCFSAFYPYPPCGEDNRSMRGLQFPNASKWPLYTESTHMPADAVPRSQTSIRPVYRVTLSYFNFAHLLVGWVEVNVQRDANRLEHPMWCLVGSNRLSQLMLTSVNELFVNYAPQISRFVARGSLG